MAYSQFDYPNVPLGDGGCGETLATAGCYVITLADNQTYSGHSIDPPTMNQLLLAHGEFVDHCLLAGDDGSLHRLWPDQWDVPERHFFTGPADLSLLDNDAPDMWVNVFIRWPNGLPTDNPHFFSIYDWAQGVPDKIRILDTDGQIVYLKARYGDPATIIWKIIRQRHLTPAPPAPAPPPPVPLGQQYELIGIHGEVVLSNGNNLATAEAIAADYSSKNPGFDIYLHDGLGATVTHYQNGAIVPPDSTPVPANAPATAPDPNEPPDWASSHALPPDVRGPF